jgi:hypothetical protein
VGPRTSALPRRLLPAHMTGRGRAAGARIPQAGTESRHGKPGPATRDRNPEPKAGTRDPGARHPKARGGGLGLSSHLSPAGLSNTLLLYSNYHIRAEGPRASANGQFGPGYSS